MPILPDFLRVDSADTSNMDISSSSRPSTSDTFGDSGGSGDHDTSPILSDIGRKASLLVETGGL